MKLDRFKDNLFLSAFTLVEVMITTALIGLVMAGAIGVYSMCNKLRHATSINMQAVRESSLALSRFVYGMGTNSGLRSANVIILLTNNIAGHPHNVPEAKKYWLTGSNPPDAGQPSHFVHVPCTHDEDGSWRLVVSNAGEGVRYIDYNSKMRNILYCPDTNHTGAARQKRLLICNYVSDAPPPDITDEMIRIQLTVEKRDGMFVVSNTIGTQVHLRNN